MWQPRALLEWWFGPPGSLKAQIDARHGLWFGKRDAQDDDARQRFGHDVARALAGELDAHVSSAEQWLALLLLLDQLPRMLYRDNGKAFSGDALAQRWVAHGLAQGWQEALNPLQRVFVYLVLEHHEHLPSQTQAVQVFTDLLREVERCEPAAAPDFANFLHYAERHRDVIARFSRYPHRNALLGRPSTPEELAFLRQPGSSF